MTGSLELEHGARAPGYWRRVGVDVWHELPGLLGANTLFLAWCTPAVLLVMIGWIAPAVLVAPVTIGPGLAGLATYAGRLARGEGARWWRDGLAGVRTRSGACALLLALGLGVAVLSGLALRLAAAHGLTVTTVAVLTVQMLVALFLVVACAHAWGLVGLYGQPAGRALRNATILAIRHPVSSAGPVGLGLVFVHVAQLFGWGPLVVLPAILALCALHHTRRLVEDARAITHETPQETTCPLP
jgi:hypothetical protein